MPAPVIDLSEITSNEKPIETKAAGTEKTGRYAAVEIKYAVLSDGAPHPLMLSAVRVVNGRSMGKFKTLIAPGMSVDGFVDDASGISDRLLALAPEERTMLPAFIAFIGNDTVVGEDMHVAVTAIDEAAKRIGLRFDVPFIDICGLAKQIYPGLGEYNAAALYSEFFSDRQVDHRTDSMADVIAKCFEIMKRTCSKDGVSIEPQRIQNAEEPGKNEPDTEAKPAAGKETVRAGESAEQPRSERRRQRHKAKAEKIERIISSYDTGEIPVEELNEARSAEAEAAKRAERERREERGRKKRGSGGRDSGFLTFLLIALTLAAVGCLVAYISRMDKNYLIACGCIMVPFFICCITMSRGKKR